MPESGPEVASPLSALGFNYGIVDEAQNCVTLLEECLLDQMKPNKTNFCYSSEGQWTAWSKHLARPLQQIYTDGSHTPGYEIGGYALWRD